MEENTNYEVTISCPDDPMYATSRTFDELDKAFTYLKKEIVGELKNGNEISIIISKV